MHVLILEARRFACFGCFGERLGDFNEARSKSPLSAPVKKPKAPWVNPVVDAEIEYAGITDDGLLRSAVFKGLREDLGPPSGPTARAVSSGVPRPAASTRPHIHKSA